MDEAKRQQRARVFLALVKANHKTPVCPRCGDEGIALRCYGTPDPQFARWVGCYCGCGWSGAVVDPCMLLWWYPECVTEENGFLSCWVESANETARLRAEDPAESERLGRVLRPWSEVSAMIDQAVAVATEGV